MTELWRPRTILSGIGDIELWNAIVSWAGQPLPLAGETSLVIRPTPAPEPTLRAHRLGLAGGASVVVVPISFPFEAMFGAAVDVDDIGLLPELLRARIERAMFASLLGAIGHRAAGGPKMEASGSLSDIGGGEAAERQRRWLELSFIGLANGGRATMIVGGAIGEVVPRLIGGSVLARPAANGIADRIGTRLTRRIGSLRIAAPGLAGLGAGDVVVLADDEARRVVLAGASSLWHFVPADGGHRLVSIEPRRSFIPQHKDTAMSERPATGPEDLAVEVDFAIGQMTVPLGTLAGWAPGTIVPLEPPQAAAGVRVALSVGGREIGYGDLVEIDQRLAVRLTHLFDRATGQTP
jgi:flagellar motor switch/type III secretory pathway protein FliN